MMAPSKGGAISLESTGADRRCAAAKYRLDALGIERER
jgi:hypothetical protein